MIMFEAARRLVLVLLLFLSTRTTTTLAAEEEYALEAVDYDHDGTALRGFKSVPEGASASNPVPAVILIHDASGVNDYEKKRAKMVSDELGYVGFAADVIGVDYQTNETLKEVLQNRTERREVLKFYRNDNPQLFVDRIQQAINVVATFDEVDGSNIAIAGYCFGGTGVLLYGVYGMNLATAIVSFHGGLSKVLETPTTVNATPKILVLSGGDDDASSDIMDLEHKLDSIGADWEITRYSNIQHAWTVFDDDRYNEWADKRSWDSMKTFLKEAFGETTTYEDDAPPDSINVEAVPYTDAADGTELQGYVSTPNAQEFSGPRPIVVILPGWAGVGSYEKQRATLLSDAGYVGFAADIYGKDLQQEANLTFDDRIKYSGMYRNNATFFVQRIQAAMDQARTVSNADGDDMNVIGYCFGGTGVIELAFSDANPQVKLVSSFHGGLTELPQATQNVTPYVLVLSGGVDDAHGNQTELEAALNDGYANWEITRYSGVQHGFTNWNDPRYSAKANVRSWDATLTAIQQWNGDAAAGGGGGGDDGDGATSSAAASTIAASAFSPSPWMLLLLLSLLVPPTFV